MHQAPAFGADDLAVGRRYGLPVLNPIGADGHFGPDAGLVAGLFFKDADEPLVADLDARGLLFRHVPYAHSYPHCWRCDTPLMYYALPSWYIRTTAIKDRLIAENEATNWFPATIKHGRYGDWLEQQHRLGAVARPLLGHPAAGVAQRRRPDQVDLRRFAGRTRRAGRRRAGRPRPAPAAGRRDHLHPPGRGRGLSPGPAGDRCLVRFRLDAVRPVRRPAPQRRAGPRAAYPADFIAEAIDQTRGWFYTLMAIGTLVFDQSSYRNVLCLGHILAEDGRKMSKHLGNILEPIPLMDRHGADAVRWFMLAGGSPWSARRVGHKVLDEIASKVLRTYWSIASFQSLYARANNWTPDAPTPVRPAELGVLDRWALSGAHALIDEVSDRAGRLRHRPGRQGARRPTSTTCRTGTCGARGGGSGTATRPLWRRCTSASTSSPGCWRRSCRS